MDMDMPGGGKVKRSIAAIALLIMAAGIISYLIMNVL
jgi:hypothetical protein